MADTFLPESYDGIPASPSNYMKLEEGENIFRVLSNAIIGYEYWTGEEKDRKPVRVKTFSDVPDEFKNNKDNRNNAKYFWAFVIYNPKLKIIQVLEIKQKGILRGLEALALSKAWGDPKNYNIMVTKTKTGSEARDVEYSVMPEPKEKLEDGVLQLYKDMNINLESLFEGKDPFKAGEEININDIPDNLG